MASAAHDVIVIGGGQAGLAAGHHLQRSGADFVILDAETRVGDTWRRRWASLRLFTPARHDGLPGRPWPGRGGYFPTADEVADYLEAYAAAFDLPVRSGTRVTAVRPEGDGYAVVAGDDVLHAPSVIVATGATSVPRLPDAASAIALPQLHSSAYRRPDDVEGDRVLVVGYGTSGAEIARELATAGRQVTIAGRPTPTVPPLFLTVAGELWWLVVTQVLNRATPVGRRIAPKATAHGAPLIRISPEELRAAGVAEVGRVDGVADGRPSVAGRPIDVDAVVWATGFRGDFSWLEVPRLAYDARGYPDAPFGVPPGVPGLGFVGIPFQTRLASHLLGGVGGDAARVVATLGRR
ncbi:flavin-containing monooxygenase [Microbacterium lacusdiani]